VIRVRGLGPLYWGIEKDSTSADKRFFTYAFLQETNPPWRQGDGRRLRLGRKEFHFGTCKKGTDPELLIPTQHSDPEVAAALRGQWESAADVFGAAYISVDE
jgi:hypothetical protein